MSPANWRFVPYAEFDGALNMGIDTALLEQALECVPTLRLYGFAPPCLTLGLNQKINPSVPERAAQKGIDIVRRPSGGRAVLHYKDITYCFLASERGQGKHGVLEPSVSAAYKQICAGLQQAFLLLGLNAELGAAEASYRHLADCFLATTNADLHFQGRKLAGSAQLRRRGAVLQHGSIPLNLEQDLMNELLDGGAGEQKPGTDRHANLFELLGRSLSMDEISESMKAGFAKAFGVGFSEQNLSEVELRKAKELSSKFVYS